MILPRYEVYRVIAEVRYAGMWFRLDGEDLFVTGNVDRLTEEMRWEIKAYKAEIMVALSALPYGCRLPTVCLNIGCSGACQVHQESGKAA